MDTNKPHFVCKLKKSIYGLIQSPQAWYTKLSQCLLQWGFRDSKSDTSMFIYSASDIMLIVLVYADDIIVTGSCSYSITRLISHTNTNFALKDLGTLSYFLALQVTRIANSVHLCQQKYIQDLLTRVDMLNCKASSTPMASNTSLSLYDGESLLIQLLIAK